MRRVVVTGMGIVSCMGNSKEQVLESLRAGRSGLRVVPELQELGFRVPVAGTVNEFEGPKIPNTRRRTMSDVARYATAAALESLEDANLAAESLKSDRVGVVVGTGAGGFNEAARAETLVLEQRSPVRLGAAGPPKIMNSTATLNLAVLLGIKGRCYSVTSACCTGADSIGHGFELIRHGLLDACICGGAEEKGWGGWGFFAAGFMNPANPISPDFAGRPALVCRPFDRDRPGVMVPSEGAGVVVLEALERARSRRATAYAEVVGYGSANDGSDMYTPSGEGLKRSVAQAMEYAGPLRIDYVNPHGAGTTVGDPVDVRVIREVLEDYQPAEMLEALAQLESTRGRRIFLILRVVGPLSRLWKAFSPAGLVNTVDPMSLLSWIQQNTPFRLTRHETVSLRNYRAWVVRLDRAPTELDTPLTY